MTVIVGLATTIGEPGIVIGADKRTIRGDPGIVQGLIEFVDNPDYNLSRLFSVRDDSAFCSVKYVTSRKIEVASDRSAALAHTGTLNQAHTLAALFLLDHKEFLKNDSALKEMLCPMSSDAIAQLAIAEYRAGFDFTQRMSTFYSPEIRKIFEEANVEVEALGETKHKICNRNYSNEVSTYLYGTTSILPGTPLLYEINYTGAMGCGKYFADGCGREYATEYLEKILDVEKGFFGLKKVNKNITLADVTEIVRGAVEYACERHPFCAGFEYVTLTRSGVQEHFNEESVEGRMDLGALIDLRERWNRREATLLQKLRESWEKREIKEDPSLSLSK